MCSSDLIAGAWTRFSAGYFLQHSPEEIAWHARLLAERDAASDEPLVALEPAAAERLREHLVQALDERQAELREPAAGAMRT